MNQLPLGIVTKVEGIQIENVEMKNERLAALVAIFRNGSATNSATYVNFNNANLCEEGIISLSKIVDVSSKLLTVNLHHNRIDNTESARCLSRSLRSHNCITELIIPIVTLEVVPRYCWSYYSQTLDVSTLATTISPLWGQSPLLSIFRLIHP